MTEDHAALIAEAREAVERNPFGVHQACDCYRCRLVRAALALASALESSEAAREAAEGAVVAVLKDGTSELERQLAASEAAREQAEQALAAVKAAHLEGSGLVSLGQPARASRTGTGYAQAAPF
jgi:hypothetical protein